MHKLIITTLLTGLFIILSPFSACALQTPHPIQLFDQGLKYLEAYRGEEETLKKAQDIFIQLIDKYPTSPLGYLGMSRITRIDAYLYGNHYNMRMIRDQSLPFALKALELGPSLRIVHENYATFEQIFNDFQKNEGLIRGYLNLYPDSPQTYFVVANSMRDQESYDQAMKYYFEALLKNPSKLLRFNILKRIGMTYLQQYGQPDKAVEYFREALELRPDCPVINEYLGLAYLQLNDYSAAIEQLTKSFKILSSSGVQDHLWQAEGYQAEQNGKFLDAIDFLEKAMSHDKHNSALHYALGNLYYKIERFDEAYKHFQQVIDLNPQNPRVYYLAGRSASLLGNKEQAIDYYRRYLQLDSDSQEAQWIRENIPDLSHK